MPKNLHAFDKVVRLFLFVFFAFAAVVLFRHWAARLLSAVFALLALVELTTSRCLLIDRLGQQSPSEPMKAEPLYLLGLATTQMVLAYEWWAAGWEKVSSPAFVGGISKTLGYFASQNPFPWYKNFLLGFASSNATLFAYAVEWSQITIALTLAISAAILAYTKNDGQKWRALAASVVAFTGGALMNANFYLAAGWTGPGARGSNVIMFWAQLVLIYVWLIRLLTKSLAGAGRKKYIPGADLK